MLCGIRKSDGVKILARMSEKAEGPFACPACGLELTIRKGRIKVHHFAHKPPYNCSHGEGESEAHRKCKESIYLELAKVAHVEHLELEVNFGAVVADVFCYISGVPVAIEVQRSNLSIAQITARTQEYEKLGINVLWLALYSEKLGNENYSPKAWEKWCHAAYFGRVYYWLTELTVVPIHFAEARTYVEEKNWYNEYGEEQSTGGFYRTSKRFKTPVAGAHLNLSSDFKPSLKNEWRGGSVFIPRCRIYGSKLNKWW